MDRVKGRAWRFGDHIDTDVIIPYKYKARTLDPKELGIHCMEGLDPGFAARVSRGDVIVAGRNFGCGSSREQAPLAIMGCGISAVIAASFARIFYRNAVNLGLPVLESAEASKSINQGDIIEISLEEGLIEDLTTGQRFKALKPSSFLMELLREGGLIEYYRRHARFPWG
ncbi:MAG: 3-isopropylmalate dehydratase small subunit [Candidatus Bathyarchaeia archaeon]